MKKTWTLFLALCLTLFSSGCTQTERAAPPADDLSEAESRSVPYTFDDPDRGVKFSIEYPEGWILTELKGHDGDENREASPNTGIQFTFFEDEGEVLTIMASSLFPFEVDESLFESAPFETNTGLTGVKYRRDLDDRVFGYYIFGSGETLPQYFAAISMRQENYESVKDDIEAVMKTLCILTD